ncbi:MAG: metallophosphoesterase [Weeksellaceae bacterium]|nr:metallophosphoesterase [Bacteroidota bacterium]MCG2781643.1 metallophosphoesterase [Weeksellaceae bacterium]
MKNIISKCFTAAAFGLMLLSCATEKAQYGNAAKDFKNQQSVKNEDIAHTFYLIGDAGNFEKEESKNILKSFKNTLDTANSNSTVIFLGDNIYPIGMPEKNASGRKAAEEKLDAQIALTGNFKGNTLFIPGNHDWYSGGTVGLKEQEQYIRQHVNDKAFAPKNSCALETRKINKDIALIIVDSQWFLADWDKNPGINEKCDLKTREAFFEEFEGELNKNQNKTVIVAMHHPLQDNGSHGGKFSLEKQLFPLEHKIPLPVLGSLMNLARATGGLSTTDLSNEQYRTLSARLQTLLAGRGNVVVVSGHDHNLQYISKNNIYQVISGAGSKNEAAAAISKNDFSYGKNGYAVLHISKSGDAEVIFYGTENEKPTVVFRQQILKNSGGTLPHFPTTFPAEMTSSVYDKKLTEKSRIHEWLFGKNYRTTYAIPVNVPVLDLAGFKGGAEAKRSGGGHQTSSLRLETPQGEYVMRALKKSGVRFLQNVAFKDQYITEDFEGGFADRFLLDFFTSAHPYSSLAVATLSDSIGLKHTNPKLYYIPKQAALGKFNSSFGNELYFVEEREPETQDGIIELLGTDDVLKLLAKDEKYKIDEKMYIRARLFDMLIGDWDRHYDQWKWEQKPEGKFIMLSPFPKDRDQAFVKYDGFLTKMILDFPELRHMQNFGEKIKNVKWFNMEAYPLDLTFTKNSTESEWMQEAEWIRSQMDSATVNRAFAQLPKEVQNGDTEEIKRLLNIRKQTLSNVASAYYKVLQKTVLLTGTNKKDKFEVNRLPNGETQVKIYRNKKDGLELVSEKTYSENLTDEIWIYGLGDDDVFTVNGTGKSRIKVRLIGGLNHDVYEVNAKENTSVYDYRSKKNTIENPSVKTILTDDYSINEYDYRKPKYSYWSSMLNLGYNPDDGVILGGDVFFVKNGFRMNPFSSRHTVTANYFTDSGGYELAYTGIFPRLTGHWFLQLNTGFTSSQFIRNYFGTGNESVNQVDIYGKEYYRVRGKEFYISPSLNWKKNASHFFIKPVYEALTIEETAGRRISAAGTVSPDVFSTQHFAGADLGFHYRNFNKNVNPTLGMKLNAEFGYRQNLKEGNRKLPGLLAGLGFTHYLTKNEKLVLSSYAEAKWLLSNDHEFYQMNTLGGNHDLRGFQFNRFYGKNSFYQSTDLSLGVGTFRNALVPINVGIFAGFDYGRVWVPNESSNQWHHSTGAGISLNALNQLGVNASYFFSEDGNRLVLALGMNF